MADVNEDRMMAAMQAAEFGRRSIAADRALEQQDIANQFRAREEQMRAQQLEIENQRNYIHAASVQSDIAQRELENQRVLKSQIASEAASRLSGQIDIFHPEAENNIKDAMATAYASGADPKLVHDIFIDQLQQVTALKQRQSEIYATRLGDDGRTLFGALQKDAGMDADSALRMTKRSLDAKATYDWYMDYASKNGMPVAPTDEELSKMRKKVGNLPPGVTVGNGDSLSDLRENVWDMDEVRRWAVTKVLTPELTKKLNAEQQFETDKRNADLAESRARTTKMGAETIAIREKIDVGPSSNFLPNGQQNPNFTPSRPNK